MLYLFAMSSRRSRRKKDHKKIDAVRKSQYAEFGESKEALGVSRKATYPVFVRDEIASLGKCSKLSLHKSIQTNFIDNAEAKRLITKFGPEVVLQKIQNIREELSDGYLYVPESTIVTERNSYRNSILMYTVQVVPNQSTKLLTEKDIHCIQSEFGKAEVSQNIPIANFFDQSEALQLVANINEQSMLPGILLGPVT